MQKTELRKTIIRQRDYEMLPHHYETIEGVSVTVPNESMSIQEIMTKHVRGIDMSIMARTPAYDSGASFDSDDIEKLQHQDIFEKQQKLESLKSFQERLKKHSTSEGGNDRTNSKKASENEPEGKAAATRADDEGGSEEGVAPPSGKK